MRATISLLLATCALALHSHVAWAAPMAVPAGLNPGDEYRLVFVTSTGAGATSSDITTYNAFVTGAANSVPELAALSTTWSVVGSTPTVSARTNTGTTLPGGLPIYNLAGALVAVDNDDLWDGALLAPINHTESGDEVFNQFVWTGTFVNGNGSSLLGLGGPLDGVLTGIAGETDNRWIHWDSDTMTLPYHYYAMSGVLTVVPEPNSLALALSLATCLAATAASRSRRRRRTHCDLGVSQMH